MNNIKMTCKPFQISVFAIFVFVFSYQKVYASTYIPTFGVIKTSRTTNASTDAIGFTLMPTSHQPLPDSLYPPKSLFIAYHSSWTKASYPIKIAEFKNAPLSTNDIVFLGNSITEQGNNWGSRLGWKNVKNRGISGDVTEGVIKRLGEITYVKPKAVFLLIGINDLYHSATTPVYVANNIFEIAKTIRKESPLTEVYVQTILPTQTDSIKIKIQNTNTLIRQNASNGTYNVLETHALFATADDTIKPEYTTDGLHLKESGYTVWAAYLKQQLPHLAN